MPRFRFRLPIIGRVRQINSLARNPARYVARRLLRFSLSLGIFGLSFGRGGIRFAINLPFLSFIFGGGKKSRGGGKKSGGGGSSAKGGGSSAKGGGSSAKGGGSSAKGGGPSEKGGGSSAKGGGPSERGGEPSARGRRGENLVKKMDRGVASLRRKREQSRQRETLERAARKKSGRGAVERDAREKAARESSERVVREKTEREKSERAIAEREKAARESSERVAREKTEREKSERATAEREKAARESSERISREKTQSLESKEPAVINRPAEALVSDFLGIDFDINRPLPIQQRVLLEASAGTGKTFSLTSLVARYVAEEGLKIEQLLMVTFTKAAAGEMRERTRAKLKDALEGLLESDAGGAGQRSGQDWMKKILECDGEERRQRISRLRDAISGIDAAAITTIHGFFQQALRDVGLRSADAISSEVVPGKDSLAKQVLRDELIRRFAIGGVGLMDALPKGTPNDLEAKLLEIIQGMDSNISAIAAPFEDEGTVAYAWASFVNELRIRINKQRSESGTISFDDLITGLRDLLLPSNPLSAAIVKSMRSKFRLVLIDEFQDTDDTQWEIFSKIFNVEEIRAEQESARAEETFLAMIMVGDPKQAIYRFRGADIAAYLKAIEDPNLVRFEMKRNFRSDRNLIVGLNRWFQGVLDESGTPTGFKFGNKNIGFIQVDAAKPGSGTGLEITNYPDETKALQLRWISADLQPKPNVESLRSRIAADLANHVIILLSEGKIVEHADGIRKERSVQPGDISVLVRAHGDADLIVEALRGQGIPVVKSSIGTVADSEAVDQLRTLLSALAAPNDSRRVKAFALTWFINYSIEDLLDERKIIDLGMRCNVWAQELSKLGIVGFYQTLRADPSVSSQISSSIDAERRFTDLEHLAELIHRSTGGKKLSATSTLRHLEEIVLDPDDNDENLRRIDTDAKAIQITTMHSSKGLEYPIVLVPYPKAPINKGVEVFTYENKRYVNAAPGVPWSIAGLNEGTRKTLSFEEVQGDELRLLYVAFTRAKHQLVVWWAKSQGIEKSPLARLLFGNHEDITKPTTALDGEEARRKLGLIKEQIGSDELGNDIMHLTELSLENFELLPPLPKGSESGVAGSFSSFPENARRDFDWRRWSFSSLSSSLKHDHSDHQRGGFDEGDSVGDESILIQDESSLYTEAGLFGMPASAKFGTLVHEILEEVDFSSPTLTKEIRDAVDSHGSESLRGIDAEQLALGLELALNTSLDPLVPGFRLVDLAARDRLAEMDFHFALPMTAISAEKIAKVAAADSTSLFSEYFGQLANTWGLEDGRKISGLMTGSIDLLFRNPVEGQLKYFVVDYKSNRLHAANAAASHGAYEMKSMTAAMTAHNYPLQALFYCVALHRFLSNRVANYDIDRDLGGAGYLFLRGMVGEQTPIVDGVRNGVLSWRPSSETILKTDAILGGAE